LADDDLARLLTLCDVGVVPLLQHPRDHRVALPIRQPIETGDDSRRRRIDPSLGCLEHGVVVRLGTAEPTPRGTLDTAFAKSCEHRDPCDAEQPLSSVTPLGVEAINLAEGDRKRLRHEILSQVSVARLAREELNQRALVTTVELTERLGIDPVARQPEELRIRFGGQAGRRAADALGSACPMRRDGWPRMLLVPQQRWPRQRSGLGSSRWPPLQVAHGFRPQPPAAHRAHRPHGWQSP